MAIIEPIISQYSFTISMVTPSVGIILQTMPSLPISMVILHIMGRIIGICMGIMPIIWLCIGIELIGMVFIGMPPIVFIACVVSLPPGGVPGVKGSTGS